MLQLVIHAIRLILVGCLRSCLHGTAAPRVIPPGNALSTFYMLLGVLSQLLHGNTTPSPQRQPSHYPLRPDCLRTREQQHDHLVYSYNKGNPISTFLSKHSCSGPGFKQKQSCIVSESQFIALFSFEAFALLHENSQLGSMRLVIGLKMKKQMVMAAQQENRYARR